MKVYFADSKAISGNLHEILKRAGKRTVWAVLKGSGYGLGVEAMANFCREAGIHHFAVTEPAEADAIRRTGTADESILMLRPTTDPNEIRVLLVRDVIFTVASQQDAVTLAGVARDAEMCAKAHIKIDTGMGRYGFKPEQKQEILSCFQYHEVIRFCGLYTHFANAFKSKKSAQIQSEKLNQVAALIREAGYDPGHIHAGNSAALFRCPEYCFDGVRVGSAILGRLPFRTGSLTRVGVCQAALEEVRWLDKGDTCGYGSAWKAKRPTRIAVLPVGWYHGYTTEYGHDVFRVRDCLRQMLSGLKGIFLRRKLTVRVGNEKCRVLGHVGMLHTVIDITDKNCGAGDIASLEINPLRVRDIPIRFEKE